VEVPPVAAGAADLADRRVDEPERGSLQLIGERDNGGAFCSQPDANAVSS
jgi:hypothetical protein